MIKPFLLQHLREKSEVGGGIGSAMRVHKRAEEFSVVEGGGGDDGCGVDIGEGGGAECYALHGN